MPITVTYDVTDLDNNDRNRIRSAFERFGSAFRYPRFDAGGVEDWLNCVVPALFFLRSFVLAKNITLRTFTLDTHAASWLKDALGAPPPSGGAGLPLTTPGNAQLGEQLLRDWVDAALNQLR